MTKPFATDLDTATHAKVFEDAYRAVSSARRTMYERAVAYVAHLIRQELPEAAALTIDASAAELHEVLDADGRPLWHAPSSAGHGLRDSTTDDVNGVLSDVMPFGSLAGAARWKAAPQGLPYRTVRLPEPEAPGVRTAACFFPTPDGMAEARATFTPGEAMFWVGSPDPTYDRETRDRIYAALTNSGIQRPSGALSVDARRWAATARSSAADLALACSALAAAGTIAPATLNGVALIGELGLDGAVRPVPDVAALVRTAQAAGYRKVIVAAADFDEVSRNTDVTPVGATTLRAVLDFLEEMAQP
ncbi:magnesium chelatase domain-containing protein [Streptomyces sp. AGS-58]|uniref:magnesium chelatase domain-containing protein n=1 Tax=unclassified Streptomyces TaxID=2593676 RepID=UPI0035A334C4